MADPEQTNLTTLTVNLLSAYFANNVVDSGQLPELIRSTHESLKKIDAGEPETPAEPEYNGAVSVRKSLGSKDHIISLIDGKPYKMLKRHLAGHGLTPAQYRERYKLASDYPMVAPTYAEQRRATAARIGLGRKPRAAVAEATPVPAEPVVEAPKPAKTPAKARAAARVASPAKTKAPAKPAAPKTGRTAKPKADTITSAPQPAAQSDGPVEAAAPKPSRGRAKAKPAASAVATTAPAKRAPRKPKAADTAPSEPAVG